MFQRVVGGALPRYEETYFPGWNQDAFFRSVLSVQPRRYIPRSASLSQSPGPAPTHWSPPRSSAPGGAARGAEREERRMMKGVQLFEESHGGPVNRAGQCESVAGRGGGEAGATRAYLML